MSNSENELYSLYLEKVNELRNKLDPEKLQLDSQSKQSYEKTFDRALYYTKTLNHSKKILELYDSIKKGGE